jgi:hypothetical protein
MYRSYSFCSCKNLIRVVFVLISIVTLSACGGGGGGTGGDQVQSGTQNGVSDNSPSGSSSNTQYAGPGTNTTSSSATLLISEAASTYYANDVAWFEIYNPSSSAINLSGYTLRSSYIDTNTNSISLTPTSFALPNVIVPAQGYLVVASRIYDNLENNSQIVYVNNGTLVPHWNGSGSIELVNNGQTVDFIRFGTSTAAPITASEWVGPNISNMPSGPNEYGRSIVRLASHGMGDTNSAQDWTQVNFATPAGPNDVAPGVIDSDGDGVPDSAKVNGGTYAGLNLYAMGARPGRRDLFLEIDHMQSTDPGVTPRQESLQKLVDVFAAKNIAVHIDTGSLFTPTFDPSQFNLGGGNTVEYASCIELATSSQNATPGCASFYDYKSRYFDVRRKFLFHYALFANSQNVGGSAGSSGYAEVYGNDLIITLGNYGFNTNPGSGLNMLINLQASTLMHELGHNLGLRHGGDEDVNYKPNHYSVMNYMYQFAGLSDTPNSIYAAERYYLANNLYGKTYCNLVENSPCTSNFRMSYSDGSSMNLDENNLLESNNIGRGSVPGAYADWNNSGAYTASSVSHNLNPQYDSSLTVLHDYDEWNHLSFPFSRYFSGANSGASLNNTTQLPRPNPMNENPQNKKKEDALPAALHTEILNTGKLCDHNYTTQARNN